jgi:hypothetical protein
VSTAGWAAQPHAARRIWKWIWESNVKQETPVYQWTTRDKGIHLLPALPLMIFYGVTICLLAWESIYLVLVCILLWAATNISAIRICAGCPYRGKYCPGICQLFIAPFISTLIVRQKKIISPARSFRVDLALIGVFGIGSYLFAVYWLFVLYWKENYIIVLFLIGCLLLYLPLSFFLLCPKCGYNEICPMARVHKAFT